LPATIVAVECAGRWFYGVQYHPEIYMEYVQDLVAPEKTMSMRCGMVPMMFPGVQQYVPPMAMAMGMGTGPSMPNPVASAVTVAAQLGRRFPVPRFNLSCCSINTETVTPDSIIELLLMSL
ncbi:transcription factor PIF1-like protein isoform X1, partial [Tanacetum coccineum]